MIPYSRKILCSMLTLIFIINLVKGQSCSFTSLGNEDGVCSADINCQSYFEVDLKAWECIKTVKSTNYYDRYNGYNYYRDNSQTVTYSSTYNLFVHVENPREENIFPVDVRDNIIKLTMDNGALINIPKEVYNMSRLELLSVSGNNITRINFDDFLPLLHLKNVSLANNMINVINTDEEKDVASSRQSNVKIIDISKNSIEAVPNVFLSSFTSLQHLNMSYNLISSIGILTFEGMMQLQTLDISNNRLFEVGNAFARFVNLRDLSLSHNNLTKLIDFDFVTLTNLEKLDVSFNNIGTIENRTFHSLRNLKHLDLRHNKIVLISNQFFEMNVNMESLSLLDNQIRLIEANSFKNLHLTEFHVKNNSLTGELDKNTFKGLNVIELNLSDGNLTCIKDEAFKDMYKLINLNLSSNVISSVSNLAFSSLLSLDVLDLSHNKLKRLDFESNDLKNLTKLYVHHNKIVKITKYVFENFMSLNHLDLSYNEIKEIEPNSFSKLNNLKLLILTNSEFVNHLKSKSLEGLTSLQKLDMSGTKTTRFLNDSFAGLVSLTDIYAPNGQLDYIEYNAFIETESLKILTLSYNQLCNFYVNTSTISQIQEIYLNDNCLSNLTGDTFTHLNYLQTLNLANNDILELGFDAFQYSNMLINLNLSANKKIKIDTNAFQSLSQLKHVSLQNIKTKITFQNSSVSVETLELQFCGISDINNVHIFNVHDILYLNLSVNNIVHVDKDSFKNMSSLISLDLSLNKLKQIQPGSFLYMRSLKKLNLSANNLPLIQYGVFDGIEGLRELDLSSNALTNFDAKLVLQTHLSELYLDDNSVTSLNFREFYNFGMSRLSIGGNKFPCHILAELTILNSTIFHKLVSTKHLDLNSENVHGISCYTITKLNEKSIIPVTYNNSVNFSPLIASLKNTIDRFSDSIQHSVSEFSNDTKDLKSVSRNVDRAMKDFIKSGDQHQITNTNFLTKLTDINNDSNIQLREIKKYLMTLAETKYEEEPDLSLNSKLLDQQYNKLRSEFHNMLKEEISSLREEFKAALSNISKG